MYLDLFPKKKERERNEKNAMGLELHYCLGRNVFWRRFRIRLSSNEMIESRASMAQLVE